MAHESTRSHHPRAGLRKLIRRPAVTLISDDWALDPTLTAAAKGVMAVLLVLAKDPGDRLAGEQVADAIADAPDTIAARLGELVAAGYLRVSGDDYAIGDDDDDEPVAVTPVPSQRRTRPGSVVYYFRRANGDIKIGFSAHLTARTNKLTEQHGELALLATEPGGWHLEHERHGQFADHWVAGEWFRPAPALLAHIAAIAAAEVAA